MYPEQMTAPMEKDLTAFGFEGLKSAAAVSEKLSQKSGTTLLVVNSVCGCAAANARPGVKIAVASAAQKPNNLVTVFAGVDKEAVAKAREFMLPYPASSPSIALFKDGKLVHFVERHRIEGHSAENIAEHLQQAFAKYC